MLVHALKLILFHIVPSAVVAVGGVDAFRIISSEKTIEMDKLAKR